jgi:hypothetical protein
LFTDGTVGTVRGANVQPTIHIRDELVLEAHLDADEPRIRRARRCAGASQRYALSDQCAELDGGGYGGVMVGDADDSEDV